jgi:hypothetical protein
MAKYREFVITDVSQVPAGFVPLANWRENKTLHNRLCQDKATGKIRACKLMRHSEDKYGPVWVHAEDARAALEVAGLDPAATKTLALSSDGNDSRVDALASFFASLEQKLERIASSLDLIADAATRVATTNEAKDAAQSYE